MREKYEEQFRRFNSDIAGHTVTVLRDDGLYRHLRCSTGSYAYQFDVITWPGYLCYAGDMGCYVFTRLPDMFEFFRGRRTAMVDRGYLSEKAVAADKPDGIRRYNEEMFRAAVKSDFNAFVEAHDLDTEQASDLWQQIEDEVLSCGDNLHDALDAAGRFRWAPDGDRRGHDVFPDFWDNCLEDYTTRFAWCCYAVPWAIEQYDKQRSESPVSAAAVDPVGERVTG